MKAAWLSDIHFEHLEEHQIHLFSQEVAGKQPELVLLGGDIAVAEQVCERLREMDETLKCPIYFVLGNHDYYGGSISAVRSQVTALSEESMQLCWLQAAGVVSLNESTALIGHGCWADGRAGDFHSRPDLLTDCFVIDELKDLDCAKRLERINSLGDEAAQQVKRILTLAFENHTEVMLLTHVPPFAEACYYQGRKTSDDILPHFVCKAVGDSLLELLRDDPEKHLTVLSGHTHGECEVDVLPNLKVMTGKAQYGAPTIHKILKIGSL